MENIEDELLNRWRSISHFSEISRASFKRFSSFEIQPVERMTKYTILEHFSRIFHVY